ncbi:MAG TPA: TlpA disulfide reductase family protein [Thiobacillus sp.]
MRHFILGLVMALSMQVAYAAAPNIPLHDLDGQPRNVNEFIGQGKWVIVVFWMHDCRICAEEIHHLGAFHTAHQAKDATVLGISIDGVAFSGEARKFAATHQLPFPSLLTEPDFEAIRVFGGGKLVGTPTHYFYDPTGRIVARKIGPISGADIQDFIAAFNSSSYAAKPHSNQ